MVLHMDARISASCCCHLPFLSRWRIRVTNLARQAISAAGAAITLATWWLILVPDAAATIILRA